MGNSVEEDLFLPYTGQKWMNLILAVERPGLIDFAEELDFHRRAVLTASTNQRHGLRTMAQTLAKDKDTLAEWRIQSYGRAWQWARIACMAAAACRSVVIAASVHRASTRLRNGVEGGRGRSPRSRRGSDAVPEDVPSDPPSETPHDAVLHGNGRRQDPRTPITVW